MSIINIISNVTHDDKTSLEIMSELESKGFRITATTIPHPTDKSKLDEMINETLKEMEVLHFSIFDEKDQVGFFNKRNTVINTVISVLKNMKVKL